MENCPSGNLNRTGVPKVMGAWKTKRMRGNRNRKEGGANQQGSKEQWNDATKMQ